MENITVKGELLFQLESKQQWIWVDKNGNVFECGLDFKIADEEATYPCKVYRLESVAVANERGTSMAYS